jgi:hypothetical protein
MANMKIHRAVTYASFLVILIVASILASLPTRFPNAMIAWAPMIAFVSPAIALVGFLLVRPVLPGLVFRLMLITGGVLSIGMTLNGRMSPFILLLFLMALAALFVQRDRGPSEVEPAKLAH